MDDYIKRKDAMDRCGWYNLIDGKHSIHAAQAWEIASIPAANVAEVVRCGECIHFDDTIPGQPNILCYQMHEDDYCSYGERK